MPSELAPLQIACPSCDEKGCEFCDNEGWLKITQCPQSEFEVNMMEFLELADFAKQGSFPIIGGTLDQSKSFLTACRFLWSEEAKAENQEWSKNNG